MAERLAGWRRVRLPQPVQVLLTSLVIVSDWIASNPDLFPSFPMGRPTRTGSVLPQRGRGWNCRNHGGPRNRSTALRSCSPPGSICRQEPRYAPSRKRQRQ
ncbi:HD domain-containing protein [Streptomyces sp. NPDC045251]|uniref:HD domain-containing protein n=1 Tax=Streptomyces sp. NPDC045251 TaxID=3155131 RepID=UPI0033CC6221